MRSLDIETTQHIRINYPAAGVSDRIAAYFIDLLVIGFYIAVVVFSLFTVLNIADRWVVIVLIIIPTFFYHFAMEALFEGQSLGKRALKIKVLKLDGSAAGWSDYFMRWIFRLVEVMLTSGTVALFAILFNGKGQRLGDIAAGTTVVKLKDKTSLSDTVYISNDEEYEPRYPQVAALNDEDITVLKEVLAAGSEYDREAYLNMLHKARRTIENKTGISAPEDVGSILFLKTVLKDYNAIYG